jgi:hypothetical protein
MPVSKVGGYHDTSNTEHGIQGPDPIVEMNGNPLPTTTNGAPRSPHGTGQVPITHQHVTLSPGSTATELPEESGGLVATHHQHHLVSSSASVSLLKSMAIGALLISFMFN